MTAVVDLRDEMDEPTDNSSDEEDVNADAPKVRQQSLDVTSINERSINKDELTRVCVCVSGGGSERRQAAERGSADAGGHREEAGISVRTDDITGGHDDITVKY